MWVITGLPARPWRKGDIAARKGLHPTAWQRSIRIYPHRYGNSRRRWNGFLILGNRRSNCTGCQAEHHQQAQH